MPADTHFAQVLVEADYRMKLIGIGLEHPPLRQMMSWVDRVNPGTVSRNALQRWFFVPNYECVKETADDLAMELVGDGVKLVNADEVVRARWKPCGFEHGRRGQPGVYRIVHQAVC